MTKTLHLHNNWANVLVELKDKVKAEGSSQIKPLNKTLTLLVGCNRQKENLFYNLGDCQKKPLWCEEGVGRSEKNTPQTVTNSVRLIVC